MDNPTDKQMQISMDTCGLLRLLDGGFRFAGFGSKYIP